jgi:type I restriction enzyme S subunit
LKNAHELFEVALNSTFGVDNDLVETTLGAIAEFKNGLNFTKSSKGEKIRIFGVKDFQNNF